MNMRVAIVPNFEQLRVVVNPDSKLILGGGSPSLSTLYAPWPDAREIGFAEIDLEGDTLRALLAEIGARYKQAGVDFEPICPITSDLKIDFDVFVNDKNYVLLTHGLEATLKDGDEVKIMGDTLGHC
jgi:molybdopterin converting factor small subunit